MLGFRIVTVLGVAAVAWGAAPAVADACSPDPCADSNRFTGFELVNPTVYPDGLIRFAPTRQGSAEVADALGYVDLSLTDEAGTTVAGELEYSAELRTYVWRPAAPLTPSGTYSLAITVDNDALSEALDNWPEETVECGDNIDELHTLSVLADSMPQDFTVEPAVLADHHVEPVLGLDTMVCCDGAYPRAEEVCGWQEVYWSDGHCSSNRGTGFITAQLEQGEQEVPPELLANLSVRLVQADGERIGFSAPGTMSARIRMDEQFCADVEVIDLVTGQPVATIEQTCVGDDLSSELGAHDIAPDLAVCTGEPYTCEADGDQWDSEACEPWDDGGGESGGSGETGDNDSGDGADESGDDNGTGGTGDTGATGDVTAGGDDDLGGRGCSCDAGGNGSNSAVAGLWMLVALMGFGASRRRATAMR